MGENTLNLTVDDAQRLVNEEIKTLSPRLFKIATGDDIAINMDDIDTLQNQRLEKIHEKALFLAQNFFNPNADILNVPGDAKFGRAELTANEIKNHWAALLVFKKFREFKKNFHPVTFSLLVDATMKLLQSHDCIDSYLSDDKDLSDTRKVTRPQFKAQEELFAAMIHLFKSFEYYDLDERIFTLSAVQDEPKRYTPR